MGRQGPHHTVCSAVHIRYHFRFLTQWFCSFWEELLLNNSVLGMGLKESCMLRQLKSKTDKIQGLNTTAKWKVWNGGFAEQAQVLNYSYSFHLDFLDIYHSLVLFCLSESNTNYLKWELDQNSFGQYSLENETMLVIWL